VDRADHRRIDLGERVVHAAALASSEELALLRLRLDTDFAPLRSVVARMAKRLMRVLMAKQVREWRFDLDDGLLESSRLPAFIASGGATRPFKQEFESPFPSTVVTLLIDHSGSMKGQRERNAFDAAAGLAWYAYQLRLHTTTDRSAEAIHATGLTEVARIRAEMMQVIARTDWFAADPARAALSDDERFAAFIAYLRTDPRFYVTSAEELLARYREVCKRIDPKLPALFKTLPRLTYGVREIPRFMAPAQTTAYYQPGSPQRGEPGWFYANTYALDQRPTYEFVPLSLHEAVPGHHFQIALAQELDGMREFRKDLDSTAFVEGWALYAERLGIEMGLFGDPYDDFGRLLYEMWRATRLVVDTGLHAFGWPREQAIAYMSANTALSEINIVNEVDRYIGWPGQACAYKIGELEIRDMRATAEAALGRAFDIRAFHDAMLLGGPLPLDVLRRNIDAWIAREKARVK
jgi:prolyl oligopeptidase